MTWGKLGSSRQYFTKSLSLSSPDTELLLVLNHRLDGADLLESFPDLKELAPVVRAHHEEFDGNGYPHGLKREIRSCCLRASSEWPITITKKSRQKNLVRPLIPVRCSRKWLLLMPGKAWDPGCMSALIQAILIGKVPPQMVGGS